MSKTISYIIGLIVIAIIGFGLFSSNKNKGEDTSVPAASNTQTENVIQIKDYAYSPSIKTVKVGTTLTWVNQDTAAHTVTAGDKSTNNLASPLLKKGESYSYTFSKPGTVSYFCEPHPYMKATIEVAE